MLRIIFSILMCLSSLTVTAQITSPQINPDHSVTFSFYVPEADDVVLKGDVLPIKYKLKTFVTTISKYKEYKLKPLNDTIWSVTIPELEPDMYMYYYEVDGEEDGDSLDMFNPLIVRDIDRKYSAFIVPGGHADYYLDTPDIPHGTLIKEWYDSTVKDAPRRRMSIYLPPSYHENVDARYPVLYLFHGTGGDENAWPECGRALQIFDNMIAKHEITPMIVVMPNCNTDLDSAPGFSPYKDTEPTNGNSSSMFGRFEASFVTDIVKHVDTTFRTLPDKANRAIAGLSLGGMQALYIAANNPDLCDYIGLFSAQTEPTFSQNIMDRMSSAARFGSGFANSFTQAFPFFGNKLQRKADNFVANVSHLDIYDNMDKKLNSLFSQSPKLFYIACGDEDFVLSMNKKFMKKLTKANYKFKYNQSAGGHTWSNWRHYLLDFLPQIFK